MIYIFSIRVPKYGREKLQGFITGYLKNGPDVVGHGFGHNNPRVYLIWIKENIFKLLKDKGFSFGIIGPIEPTAILKERP